KVAMNSDSVDYIVGYSTDVASLEFSTTRERLRSANITSGLAEGHRLAVRFRLPGGVNLRAHAAAFLIAEDPGVDEEMGSCGGNRYECGNRNCNLFGKVRPGAVLEKMRDRQLGTERLINMSDEKIRLTSHEARRTGQIV